MTSAGAAPDRDAPDRDDDLPVGGFAGWLAELEGALRGERPSDVPCAGCTACCTASQFVHIGPDERETLARIPAALRFPAPGLPRGHVVLGYDEHGCCPMLVEGACSIYEHRPRACRTYDCRIFPATRVDVSGDHPEIGARARRWTFTVASDDDRARRDAVQAAADYLRRNHAAIGDDLVPADATRLAVLAVEVHRVFLEPDGLGGRRVVPSPPVEHVTRAVERQEYARGTGRGGR